MRPISRLLVLAALLLAGPLGAAFAAPFDDKVEALLKQMTLEEKIGQMTLFTSDYDTTGPSIRSEYLDDLRKGRVGAIFNALTPDFTRKLQKIAVEETRLKIPLLFGYDVIHGYRTIFPIPLGEASSFDMLLLERTSRVAATEAAADGVHWTFAPMVDIARDPRWGRIAEGCGEDPYLGQLIARARVKGFQGKDLAAIDSVLACAKHYAAYGAAQAGRDYNTTDLSERELYSTYLPPFHAAVDAGCATIMTAFNDLNGVPCSANSFLLDDVLRKQWKWGGFVVTDYTSITEMIEHGNVADKTDAARQAAIAGVDMDMQSAAFMDKLPALVKSGQVPMATVDNAVRRILRYKFAKGLFANPYANCDNERAKLLIMSAANRAAARDSAKRSVVLLKNQGQVLPLRPNAKIALIGPLGDNRKEMLGMWAAQGQGDRCVSLLEGLRAAAPGAKITTARGCDFQGTDQSGFDAAVKAAREADVVVAAMGESMEWSGEAASRANPDLPAVQRALLAALKGTGKPVVLVLFTGRPLTIAWEQENLDAIVNAWFLGTEAGNALGDVLFGAYNPAGRLTVTFPRVLGQVPIYYNHKNTGRPMDPKNKYTSKYLDAPNDPLYPFGFGLSYTTFSYSPLTLSATSMGPTGSLTVSCNVTNSGGYDGEEVAQLYIHDKVGNGVTRPVKELKGFQKIMIPKGQSKTVTFTIKPSDLAFYRKDMTFGSEPGDFTVWVGPSSASGPSAEFTLTP